MPQLVARFNVNRTTVLAHLERNGVPRRSPLRKSSDDDEAADIYRDGLCLATIGRRFGVDPTTVGKALRRLGVQVRPRRGWASS